ncbi:hypothetical protein C8R44DRAFT_789658 [Mycena epipterygia]|nr:hypothetical protein C8R44DRAFT_789658 [Mycena epipterygia]
MPLSSNNRRELKTLRKFFRTMLKLLWEIESEPLGTNAALRKRLLRHCYAHYKKLGPNVVATRRLRKGASRTKRWFQVISGAAEAARAARAAAFQERLSLSVGKPASAVARPEKISDLAISFPHHLAEKLLHVSAGDHGWMFAVDKAVADTFATTTQSICKLVRMTEDGHKSALGLYRVHRWYEADMYGPEFLQLSEQDEEFIISRLTHAQRGTEGFNTKAWKLAMSEHTIACLFLESLSADTAGRKCTSPKPPPEGHASRSRGSGQQSTAPAISHAVQAHVAPRRVPVSVLTICPPTFAHSGQSSTHATIPPISRGMYAHDANAMPGLLVPALNVPQRITKEDIALRPPGPPIRATIRPPPISHAVTVHGAYVPPARVTVPTANFHVTSPTANKISTCGAYVPPARVTVPTVQFNVTPNKNSTHAPRPIVPHPTSKNHRYPHYKPHDQRALSAAGVHNYNRPQGPSGYPSVQYGAPFNPPCAPPIAPRYDSYQAQGYGAPARTYWDQNYNNPSSFAHMPSATPGMPAPQGLYSNVYRPSNYAPQQYIQNHTQM